MIQARTARRRRSGAKSTRRSPKSSSGPAQQAEPDGPLQSSVLVLNRGYLAIHVINIRRAVGLLFQGQAEVIHFEAGQFANYDFDTWVEASALWHGNREPHEDWIRSVNFCLRVPRVIRLLVYDRVPQQQLHLNRRNVLARDNHTCQYCGVRLPPHQLSVDHVVPRSRGGISSWENLVCACLICNTRKGGRTPREARMQLIARPYRPRRSPLLYMKLKNPKYASWRTWLDAAGVQ